MRLVKGLIVSFKFKRGEKLTFDSNELLDALKPVEIDIRS